MQARPDPAPPPAARLSWSQALAWRLGRHCLVRPAPAHRLAEVTGQICGLHAQVMSSAELAAAARLDGLAADAVARALWHDRQLVKLWGMRGTLHLLPAAELGCWLAAFGTYASYRASEGRIMELADTVGGALHGVLRTRGELAAEVARRSGSAELGELVRGSWGQYLKPASFRGKLCFAPSDGPQARFTAPASWIPGGVAETPAEQALGEVTRRYLGAYGPATHLDLARWWGVGPAQATRMLRRLGNAAVHVDVEGGRYWMLAEHVAEAIATRPTRTVNLLPAFDPWVVGASRSESRQLALRYRPRVYRGQGWISPVLLVNGRIVGTWSARRKSRLLQIEIVPFTRPGRWIRARAEAAAGRLAGFAGATETVTWLE